MNTPLQPTPAVKQTLPVLPIAPSQQVFIHPDHEQGKLVIPAQQLKKTASISSVKAFVALCLLVIAVGIFVATVVFVPKSQAFSYASKSKEALVASRDSLTKVNQSLDTLYKSQNATEPTNITVSKENVLGAVSVSANLGFYLGSAAVLERAFDVSGKNTKVKAFSTPVNDPAAKIRKGRDLATETTNNVNTAKESLSLLTELKNKNVPDSAAELKKTLTKIDESANEYIDQAGKTSDYFIDISDALIALTTLSSSINTTTDIDNGISKLSALKSKFSDKKNLPEKMTDYNNDIVSMFDLLVNFYQKAKDSVNGGKVDMTLEYAKFTLQIKSIANKAASDVTSFWKANKSLSGFDNLKQNQGSAITKSQKVKDDSYFFLLDWLGIK